MDVGFLGRIAGTLGAIWRRVEEHGRFGCGEVGTSGHGEGILGVQDRFPLPGALE